MSAVVLALHRVAHALLRLRVPLAPRFVVWLVRIVFGCYVGAGARIGKRCVLGYGGLGVVIHDKSVIGDEVRIGAHVVIGGRSKLPEVPVIEDRAVISAGAKVLGPIRVGRESVIGANAVVVADVAPRTVVGGVPARVLKTDIDIRRYHDDLALEPPAPLPSAEERDSRRASSHGSPRRR